jgi:hypothetical protein
MKKVTVFLCSLAMVFCVAGVAGAISFSETKTLNELMYEGGDTFSYWHSTPGDFEVPFDTVESATLKIVGSFVSSDNNVVEVSEQFVGNLTTGFFLSTSYFNIESIFDSWGTGAPFRITINTNGKFWDGALLLSSSTFNLNYENLVAPIGTTPNGVAPVPEPSTVLLMGVGLLGLVAVGRRKFNCKE